MLPLATLVLSVRLSDTGLPQLTEALLFRVQGMGLFPDLRFQHLEAAANVLVFVPIGFLLTALLGKRRRTTRAGYGGIRDVDVWLAATTLSAGIELVQFFLLTERSATVRDFVCNSMGAFVGVLVFRAVQIVRQRPRRRSHHVR